jgi:hypothetical protein
LPYATFAILSSVPTNIRSTLVSEVVDKLFVISRAEVDIGLIDMLDIPQVHGINILCHLISSATLYPYLISKGASILEDSLILAIDAFSSPSYGLRNCALSLFAAVFSRLFARRISSFDFAVMYPRIWKLIFVKLEDISLEGSAFLHPALHPLLTIFASCITVVA